MNEVLEFIKRRFSANCNWLDGNCFYFSIILLSRFPQGSIWYDTIQGHFVFQYNGDYYDWTGKINPIVEKLIEWDKFEEYDSNQKQWIIRDCIM